MSNPERYDGYVKEVFVRNMLQIMKEHNLTQAQLGDELGYGQSTISTYLSNEKLPSLDFLKAVHDRFGVPMEHLLSDDVTNFTYEALIRLILMLDDNIIVEAKEVAFNGKLGESHRFFDIGSKELTNEPSRAVALVFSDETINSFLLKWVALRNKLCLEEDTPENEELFTETYHKWCHSAMMEHRMTPIIKRKRIRKKGTSSKGK